jgi:hypothetical protein
MQYIKVRLIDSGVKVEATENTASAQIKK